MVGPGGEARLSPAGRCAGKPAETRFVVCSLGVRLASVSGYSGARPWAAWFT